MFCRVIIISSAFALSFSFLAYAGNWCIEDPANPPCEGAPGQCTINIDGSEGGFVADTARVQAISFFEYGRRNVPYIGKFAQVCGSASVHVTSYPTTLGPAIEAWQKMEILKQLRAAVNCCSDYDELCYRTMSNIFHACVGGYLACSESYAYFAALLNRYGVRIEGRSKVIDHAEVFGNARILNNAFIGGSAKVSGNAIIYGSARILDEASISEYAEVGDNATVSDHAIVSGKAKVFDSAHISGRGKVRGNAWVYENATVSGGRPGIFWGEYQGGIVSCDMRISGNTHVGETEETKREYETNDKIFWALVRVPFGPLLFTKSELSLTGN